MPTCSDPTIQPIVLVVDDDLFSLKLMSKRLSPPYHVMLADNGASALQMASAQPQPDLILLDVEMPGVNGYEVCRQLKSDEATRDIPVLFFTAHASVEEEEFGLSMGAVDYLSKMSSEHILLARIKTHLGLKAEADFLRDKSRFLESQISGLRFDVNATQDIALLALTSMAETRDNETGNHIQRTQWYVKTLAKQLSTHPRFAAALSERSIELMFKSAPLHDIGKVGIRDAILRKPGKLDATEFEVMKTHPTLGREIIEHAEHKLGSSIAFLSMAKEIAFSHHEKWDGSGYPQGLRGEAIPLSARIMAVADVYDALISRRVYKEGMSHEEATALIVAGRGRHFDPDIVDAFLDIQDEFKAISSRFADPELDITEQKRLLQRHLKSHSS